MSTIYYALCLQCLEAVPVFTVAAGTLVMGIAPNDRRGQDAAAGFLIAHSGPRHRLPELVAVAERTLRVGIEVGDTMILVDEHVMAEIKGAVMEYDDGEENAP